MTLWWMLLILVANFETVTCNLQMCWALIASHNLVSHTFILILKYPKCWVLNCSCKRFCQKSSVYSRWQNTLKNNNWFRSFVSTFSLLVEFPTIIFRTKITNKNTFGYQLVTQARNFMPHGLRPCWYSKPFISTTQSSIVRVSIMIKFKL